VDVAATGASADERRWMIQFVDLTARRLADREREETLSFLSHDLRSPTRSDTEHSVHARHAQAVPRCVQEAARQRGVEHRNCQAYLFRGGFARAVSRGDADGAYPLHGQARGHFHDVSS